MPHIELRTDCWTWASLCPKPLFQAQGAGTLLPSAQQTNW